MKAAAGADETDAAMLDVDNLKVALDADAGLVKAIDGLTLKPVTKVGAG